MARRIHPNQQWLEAAQAAEFAGVTRRTILAWAQKGLVMSQPNKRKSNRKAYQYYLPDIKEKLGII